MREAWEKRTSWRRTRAPGWVSRKKRQEIKGKSREAPVVKKGVQKRGEDCCREKGHGQGRTM